MSSLKIGPKAGRIIGGIAGAYILSHPEDVMGFIRNYLIERTLPFTPGQFAGAIVADMNLWNSFPPNYQNILYNLAASDSVKRAFQKYFNMVTVKQIVVWYCEPECELDEKIAKAMHASIEMVVVQRQALGSVIINWPDQAQSFGWLEKNRQTLGQVFMKAMTGQQVV